MNMVKLMLDTLFEYKSLLEYRNSDFNADKSKQYEALLKCFMIIFKSASGTGALSIITRTKLSTSHCHPHSVWSTDSPLEVAPQTVILCRRRCWWESFRCYKAFGCPYFLQRVEYMISERLSPGFPLKNATIALQPASAIVLVSWFGIENTAAQLFMTDSLINFCRADFFPIPKILDVVSHPVNA